MYLSHDHSRYAIILLHSNINNVGAVWDAVYRESYPPVTSRQKQRQPPFTSSGKDHMRERHSSVASRPELPPSIKLSPPPDGEMLHLPKTPQKVEQMNPRKIAEEYVP